MTILLATTAIIALAMLALGLGVTVGRRVLRGSCGDHCACPKLEGAGSCPRRQDASGRRD